MRVRVKVGDIFQILTSHGVCHGQAIHSHPKYQYVIAVFRDFCERSPSSYLELTTKEPQFITTFLLQDAIEDGLFTIVGSAPVCEDLRLFPTFRGTNNLKGENTIWWFWDGEKEWKVDRPLTEKERKYPEGPSLPSAPMIVEMIEKDYRVDIDHI